MEVRIHTKRLVKKKTIPVKLPPKKRYFLMMQLERNFAVIDPRPHIVKDEKGRRQMAVR